MNTERLHAIAIAIIDDINTTKTDSTLKALVDSLQKQVSQPQAPEFQQQVSKQFTTLNTSLKDAPSNNFSPAWRQVLEELGLNDLLGDNLLKRVQKIFESNTITPSVALEELRQLNEQLVARKAALGQVIAAFKQLEIGAEELEPGQCEVGILIPRSAINDKLNEFANALKELNTEFGAFCELTIGSRPGFKIRSVSSSELSVFLQIAPIVMLVITIAVERIVGIYKQILEIRKLHGEMKNQGVPSKALKDVLDYANKKMSEGIEKLVPELLDKYYQNKDAGRRNELATELRFSLNKIAKRIDKGYSVEVRAQSPSEEDKSSEAEYIKVILAASKNLQFLRLEGEAILTLPESQDSAEEKG